MYKDATDSFVPHVFTSKEAAEAGYEHYKKIRRGNRSAQAKIALLQEQLAKLSAEIIRLKEERNDTEQ